MIPNKLHSGHTQYIVWKNYARREKKGQFSFLFVLFFLLLRKTQLFLFKRWLNSMKFAYFLSKANFPAFLFSFFLRCELDRRFYFFNFFPSTRTKRPLSEPVDQTIYWVWPHLLLKGLFWYGICEWSSFQISQQLRSLCSVFPKNLPSSSSTKYKYCRKTNIFFHKTCKIVCISQRLHLRQRCFSLTQLYFFFHIATCNDFFTNCVWFKMWRTCGVSDDDGYNAIKITVFIQLPYRM